MSVFTDEGTASPAEVSTTAKLLRARPEARLWLAVIEDALRDAQAVRHPRRAAKARAWFGSTDERPMTFRWALGLIGLDVDDAQAQMRRRLASGTTIKVKNRVVGR